MSLFSNQPKSVSAERALPESLQPLERLSWNYWWCWSDDGTNVFCDLDPKIWETCEQNPRRILHESSEYRLMQMATDLVFPLRVKRLATKFDAYMNQAAMSWARTNLKAVTPERPVAYFCAEYGIHNSLPLYSGGLGMLAGDHLKSASDLGVPLVAVGLLYRYGYFKQKLTRDGWQEETYGEHSPSGLPLRPVLDTNGTPILVEVVMRGRAVQTQAWRAEVGRVTLLLLDTNVDTNEATDRWITGHLYGGDRETRLVQEMLLGIGGIRLLQRLGISPSIFHLNEGHSAFLTLELARQAREKAPSLSFPEAAATIRKMCVFTTHTPVPAGHDQFEPTLIDRCFSASYVQELGLQRDDLIALGRVNINDQNELFGVTPLALKLCGKVNGVSRKHGEVSRELWKALRPENHEIPITYITNGVHAPTWTSSMIRSLYTKYIGENWSELIRDSAVWAAGVERIPDEELWRVHSLLRKRLIAFTRLQSYLSRTEIGATAEEIEAALYMFDEDALTIGFARRVAAYKRWGLLFADAERLLKLIDDKERPVQFIFAGKAHPQDLGAKQILQQFTLWRKDPRVRRRCIFIQDYDQEVAREMVQGVDVWMNLPRRPLEASGTSGQKVAMNGGLNMSILDGWWAEGYDGNNGWAVGSEDVGTDAAAEDTRDAESLYKVLEESVIPLFYDRDENNIPRRWLRCMKHALSTLPPTFNSDRMVNEYAEKMYL